MTLQEKFLDILQLSQSQFYIGESSNKSDSYIELYSDEFKVFIDFAKIYDGNRAYVSEKNHPIEYNKLLDAADMELYNKIIEAYSENIAFLSKYKSLIKDDRNVRFSLDESYFYYNKRSKKLSFIPSIKVQTVAALFHIQLPPSILAKPNLAVDKFHEEFYYQIFQFFLEKPLNKYSKEELELFHMIKMTEKEKKYIDAFHDFFGKAIHTEYTSISSVKVGCDIINKFELAKKSISGRFEENNFPLKVAETQYYTSCTFTLRKLTDSNIDYLFRNIDYNYDLVTKIINDLFNMGQSFGFYTEMTPIKNFEIKDYFSKIISSRKPVAPTVTKLTLSTVLSDKSINGKLTKKTAVLLLEFKLSEDNELHPVLCLAMPYSVSNFTRIYIHLHPSKRTEQINQIPIIIQEFEELLIKQLDFVLNRTLKIKKEELKNLTLSEKRDYLTVIEMSKI